MRAIHSAMLAVALACAARMVAFIFAFGELGATVRVAPPGTLPVRVYPLSDNPDVSRDYL